MTAPLGREPEGRPRRYHVEVPLTLGVYVNAEDSAEAVRAASAAVAEAMAEFRHTDPIKVIRHLKTQPPIEVWAGDDLKPLPEDAAPAERSAHLFRLCHARGGPRLSYEDVQSEVQKVWPLLTPEERLRCYGAWSQHGVDPSKGTGTAFRLPAARFCGEWEPDFSYPGYTAGVTWNGWEVPYFTRATLDDIAKRNPDIRVVEDPGTGCVEVIYDDPDSNFTLTPETTLTVDGLVKLYRFGGGWCWDLAKDG